MNKIEKLYEYLKKDKAYKHSMTLLNWDLETQAAKESVEGISETLEILSELEYSNLVNDEFKELLYSINTEELDDIYKKVVEKLKEDVFEKMSKIPKDEYSKYQSLIAKSSHAWEIAKNNNDYNDFKDYLKQMIQANKKLISYRYESGHPYNILLDDYEKGLTVEKADEFFKLLKEELSPLILEIQANKHKVLKDIKERFEKSVFDIETQRKISKELSTIIGFDYNKGVIAESEHPFTTNMNNKDVRMTTHYYLEDVLSSIYSTVHETGHAIYEQQIDDIYDASIVLSGGSTMGIHEAQSRFYENVIGKMKAFSYMVYDILNKYQKLHITKEELHILINEVKSQFIRTEADELTYPIHVMIRYEIEKKIFEDLNSEVNEDELKIMWNDMYEKYLGIRPNDDKEGILQDSHWSAGLFGYFPSYAIGSAYASQMFDVLNKEYNVEELISKRDFKTINEFFKERIHKYGSSLDPEDMYEKCFKEDFEPKYYINYLKEKFSKIYLEVE